MRERIDTTPAWARQKPSLALIRHGTQRPAACALLALDFDVRVVSADGDRDEAYDADALLLLAAAASFRHDVARIRARSELPLVVVLDDTDVTRSVGALEAGADDVLSRPYDDSELLARLRAVMRRVSRPPARLVRVADLEIDLDRRDVRRAGRAIALSRTEFDLLCALARRSGVIVPHDQLLRDVWGNEDAANIATLHTFISGLRSKVDEGTARPMLRTVRGIGYVLDPAT